MTHKRLRTTELKQKHFFGRSCKGHNFCQWSWLTKAAEYVYLAKKAWRTASPHIVCQLLFDMGVYFVLVLVWWLYSFFFSACLLWQWQKHFSERSGVYLTPYLSSAIRSIWSSWHVNNKPKPNVTKSLLHPSSFIHHRDDQGMDVPPSSMVNRPDHLHWSQVHCWNGSAQERQ